MDCISLNPDIYFTEEKTTGFIQQGFDVSVFL